ncbi:MAG TPA: pitrilysin family protein [Patescibacteria group bacterium]|nr:pitrilysin family protein [Patescibacteria group bacterium]
MYKKTIFDNKTRVIEVPSKETKAVTLFFLFGVGSRYEDRSINGISHFIEHLMFKGTEKRPTTLDIAKELDSLGAEFNAMTSKDYTGYYIKIHHEKLKQAVDILSDMILNSKFDSVEIKREKNVIVEEINMYQDNPLMHVEEILEAQVFKGHKLGQSIAGPASTVKKITDKQILDYKNDFYRPDNLAVVAAGKIDKDFQKIIKTALIDKMVLPKCELKKFKKFTSKQSEPRISLNYKKTKQVQLAFGFPAFGYDDSRTYALHLLSIILGGNMSSRLFTSVRERQGLCYFIRCQPSFYKDTGNLYIQAGLDPSRLDSAISIILKELKKIKTKSLTARELRHAKDFLQGKITIGLEDSSHVAEYYAKQEIVAENVMTPEEKQKKYEDVDLKQIRQVAEEVLQKNKLNMALIGPFKSKKRFDNLIKL